MNNTANFNFFDAASAIDLDGIRQAAGNVIDNAPGVAQGLKNSAIDGMNGIYDLGVNVGERIPGAQQALGQDIPEQIAGLQQPLNDAAATVAGAPSRALNALKGAGESLVDGPAATRQRFRVRDMIPESLTGGSSSPIPDRGAGFEEFSPLRTMQNAFTPDILEGDGKLPLNRDPKGFVDNIIERTAGGFQRATNDGAGSVGELMEPGNFKPRQALERITAPVQGMSNGAKAGLGAAGAAIGANLGLAGAARNAQNAQQGLSTAQKVGIGVGGAGALAAGGLGLNKLRTMDE